MSTAAPLSFPPPWPNAWIAPVLRRAAELVDAGVGLASALERACTDCGIEVVISRLEVKAAVCRAFGFDVRGPAIAAGAGEPTYHRAAEIGSEATVALIERAIAEVSR